MKRASVLIYGAVAYVIFLVTFLYAIPFVGGFLVPRTVDAGGPVSGTAEALLVDVALLGLFAVQHSVMARRGFKRHWRRVVPDSVERSTYVLVSSLALVLLFWQWRPLPDVVWAIEGDLGRTAVWVAFATGWLLVLAATFMISHFDLFGLRQVWLRFRERPYGPIPFQLAYLYRFVRHPLLLGFIIAFWSAPTMTAGHLLFAIATTGYILVGIQLEERDLALTHGQAYERYKATTPMLLPLPGHVAPAELPALDRVNADLPPEHRPVV